MKLYIIAGEASGDLHGSNLIHELKLQNNDLIIRAWGGDLMEAETGSPMRKHIKELAFMGFLEVAQNIKTVLGNIDFCKKDILDFKPEAIIFIDYPGFNLRICEWAKKQGFKTIYYIAPQVWAWKENRVQKIKQFVDELIVILPFEVEYFKKFGISPFYAGHPLLDVVNKYHLSGEQKINNKILAILPGSRKKEIEKMLLPMVEGANRLKKYDIKIAGAPSIHQDKYLLPKDNTKIEIIYNKTHELLNSSRMAIVKSGTSTLESALFLTPEVVCYKGSNISYQIAKRLIKIKYISLVNLIMDAPIVKELIQNEMSPDMIFRELEKLEQPSNYLKMQEQFLLLRDKLGTEAVSEKIASFILGKM